jgi:uncharacterized protein YbjT (DUF2867 family)
MRVAIAGAHGKIALALAPMLIERGLEVDGLIRNREHERELKRLGVRPLLCDLENASDEEITTAVADADAVVFAAGAGPGSGAERKLTVDRDGAIKLIGAGPRRYVIVSSVGAENPPDGDEVFEVYLRAKHEADEALKASGLDWTILRPGRLTDESATGRLRLDTEPFRGEVTRADVAHVIADVLGEPRSHGRVLYVNGGETPVDEALAAVLG